MFINVFYRKMILVLLAVMLLLAGLMVAATTSYGQNPEWSSPILLSTDKASSWFPDIIADATGRVHIAWASTNVFSNTNAKAARGFDVVMYTTSPNGQEWTEAIDIVAFPQVAGSAVTRPALLIDKQGVFHMTSRYNIIYYFKAPVQRFSSDVARLSPRRISTSGIAYFSRLALDKQNRLHLVLTQQIIDDEALKECPGCFHLFYRQSDDGGVSWSAPTDISILPTGSAKPQLAIDSQSNLHVVWEAGRGGDLGRVEDPIRVMYAASYDRGHTWTSPIEFVAPNGFAKHIALGIDGQDNLVVVWSSFPDRIVYYQFSRDRGRSWSPPQPIAGIRAGGSSVYESVHDDYSMATDSAGNVHLVLAGHMDDKEELTSLLHLTWDGSSWSEPEAITTLIGNVPEWPRIAVGLGNQLHVVWYVRDKEHLWDTDRGRYSVWYSHGTSSAPAIAPVTWPAPTAAPKIAVAVTSTPTAAPTPTPTPTLAPDLQRTPMPEGATDVIFTESDDLLLLAKSLIPAALIIAMVVAGVRLRRR